MWEIWEKTEFAFLHVLTHRTGRGLSKPEPIPNRDALCEMADGGEGKSTGKVRLLVEALPHLLWSHGRRERFPVLSALSVSFLSVWYTFRSLGRGDKGVGHPWDIGIIWGQQQDTASSFGCGVAVIVLHWFFSFSLGQRQSLVYFILTCIRCPIVTSTVDRPLQSPSIPMTCSSHCRCPSIRPPATSSDQQST